MTLFPTSKTLFTVALFIEEIFYAYDSRYVVRKLRNRVLVIDDEDRNTSPSEAPRNAESRMFASDHDCPDFLLIHECLSANGFDQPTIERGRGQKLILETRIQCPPQNKATDQNFGRLWLQ